MSQELTGWFFTWIPRSNQSLLNQKENHSWLGSWVWICSSPVSCTSSMWKSPRLATWKSLGYQFRQILSFLFFKKQVSNSSWVSNWTGKEVKIVSLLKGSLWQQLYLLGSSYLLTVGYCRHLATELFSPRIVLCFLTIDALPWNLSWMLPLLSIFTDTSSKPLSPLALSTAVASYLLVPNNPSLTQKPEWSMIKMVVMIAILYIALTLCWALFLFFTTILLRYNSYNSHPLKCIIQWVLVHLEFYNQHYLILEYVHQPIQKSHTH